MNNSSETTFDSDRYLGIEIGGTKLQVGVGRAGEPCLDTLRRLDVDVTAGAAGILQQIEGCVLELTQQYAIRRIGIGFGGPVDYRTGRVVHSHQVAGWENFSLAGWCENRFRLPTLVENDCDVAGLAEATIGAGRGKRVIFYVTIGSGVGGGLVMDNRIYHGTGKASAEIGHLRPGLQAVCAGEVVESVASGWSIEAAARARLSEIMVKNSPSSNVAVGLPTCGHDATDPQSAAAIIRAADGILARVTTKIIGQAAAAGNRIAIAILQDACRSLGWAVAQTITLVAPDIVIVGGGVAQLGEELFLAPICRAIERYVFPPLLQSYEVRPAALGTEVVVRGALALAASADQERQP